MVAPRGRYVDLPTPTGVQRWRLAFRKQTNYGCIDWDSRTIFLRPNQSNAELVDTIVHETRHVADGTGEGYDEGLERQIERGSAGATAALLRLNLIVGEDD